MDEVRLRYIKDTIDQLPKGNITYKTIHGKKYPYYQWQENGKQRGNVMNSKNNNQKNLWVLSNSKI